jgi:hypothetical protein
MNSRAVLIILSLATATYQAASCNECTAAADSEKSVCGSDGVLYSDLFCAQCISQDNYELFTCTAEMKANNNCQEKCTTEVKTIRCREKCQPVADTTIITCGSNGIPYNSQCLAKCLDPHCSPSFSCSTYGLSIINCYTKCKKFLRCKGASSGSSPQLVCGVDGLMYTSVEELVCNNVKQVLGNDGEPNFDVSNCMEYVNLHYGKPVGLVLDKPIVFYPMGKTD